MTSEAWRPNVAEGLSRMRRAEREMEVAVRRGLQPLLNFILKSWEREVSLSAVAASGNLGGFPQALRFTISDDEWERFSPELARQLASQLGFVLEMGAEASMLELGGVTVNWNLQSPEAISWMRSWSLDLAKGLVQTTKESLRETLARGLELGESRDDLARRVRVLIQDVPEWRSRLIAQSETIRAYNQGHLQVYKSSGVVEKVRWLDGQAGACDLCQALNGQEVVLGELFEGGIDSPPRHPGCRCDSRGIVLGGS